MKKIIASAICLLTLTTLIISCKSEPKTVTLKPKTTKIKGKLGNYYQVVDKEYSINGDKYSKLISITLKRINNQLPFNPEVSEPYGSSTQGYTTNVGFGIEFIDEKDNVINVVQATADGLNGVYSHDDIVSLINLQNDETGIVRWSVNDEIANKAKYFVITSAIKVDTNSYSDINTSSSNNNIDQLLDSYESYVKKYIKAIKNVQAGNGVLSDYSDLLQEATNLSTELGNVNGSMTASQLKRFTKIQQKMTGAL